MFFVDSHCHLIFSRFNTFDSTEMYSVDAIIKRAISANVKYMLLIGTELSDIQDIQDAADAYPNVFRTIGIHPLEVERHQSYEKKEIIKIIENNCEKEKTVGIGEIGLDYHRVTENIKQQKKFFEMQLEIATQYNLPVSIHSREAANDTIDILKNHSPAAGVIHCFSGEENLLKALNFGFYISVSGIVTYGKTQELHDMLKYIPLDRLLIETDSPFLAPVPFRGKLNEPAFVVYTAKKISELLGISVEKIAEFSSRNFFELFKKAKPLIKNATDA